MIKITQLDKTFYYEGNQLNSKHALNHVDLEIKDGEFVTVIGSNGSGKSTLLNTIAGTITSDSGTIILDDKDITKLKPYKRAKFIGRVFQDPLMGTIGDMLVEENMYLAYQRGKRVSLKWGLSNKNRNHFKDLLTPIGLDLENRIQTKMKDLSGGQRQSITLIMATMNNPHILLLDEHTAALDPETARKVMELTNKIVLEKHISTLMVTHNMKDAIKYGDRLIMMDEGKIILDISGKQKEELTVEKLIKLFQEKGGEGTIQDSDVLVD